MAYIAYSTRSTLYVVPRPQTDYKLEMLPEKLRKRIVVLEKLEDVAMYEGDSLIIVLETYGLKYLSELELGPEERVVLVIGAEDYGVPEREVAKLPRYIVAKLPIGVEGMSYNVVSSLVMALYEIKRRRSVESRG